MIIRCLEQGFDLRAGTVTSLENLTRPSYSCVNVEVAAKNYRQIDVFQDVTFCDDPIDSGAFDTVLNSFSNILFTKVFNLPRKEFSDVLQNAVLELLELDQNKHFHLLFPKGEHRPRRLYSLKWHELCVLACRAWPLCSPFLP